VAGPPRLNIREFEPYTFHHAEMRFVTYSY
jgi:hypothetical protein